MKTYQSGEPKKRMSKRLLGSIIAGSCLIVLALAITLPLVLIDNSKPVSGGGNNNPPSINYVMPMAEFTLGQEFSIDELVYSSTLNRWSTHKGVDFIAPKGTEVKAIADGTVTSVQTTTMEGYVITVTHANNVVSVYKSLGEDVKVEEGQKVKAGDTLGTVDTTMITEQTVGSHLHLEMKVNNEYVDPMEYLPGQGDK